MDVALAFVDAGTKSMLTPEVPSLSRSMRSMRSLSCSLAIACGCAVLASGCGASKPIAPSGPAEGRSKAAGSADARDDEEVPPATKAAVAGVPSEAMVVPIDATGVIPLELLITAPGNAKDYPKRTVSDKACITSVDLSGDGAKDYDALVAACGAPTGLKEYVRHVTGRLDAQHPRDTFRLKMIAGMCYRMFAVGDESVSNIDVRVQHTDGSLVSIDDSKQAVAIIDPDQTWCKKHDRDFDIIIETKSPGRFSFGVWARPAGAGSGGD